MTSNDDASPTGNVTVAALVNTGSETTSSVSTWSSLPAAFVAVIVTSDEPVTVGVPVMVAVPSPSSENVRPAGSVPVSVSAGAGWPVVVTVHEPGVPTGSCAVDALVTAGASRTTTDRCCSSVPASFVARTTTGKVPETSGAPAMTPEPSANASNSRPGGSEPTRLSVAVGVPDVIRLCTSNAPRVKVAVAGLENSGTVYMRISSRVVTLPAAFVAVTGTLAWSVVVGVPLSVPVPSPWSTNVRPAGRVPTLRAGAGEPEAVTRKVPARPVTNVVVPGLVTAGVEATSSVTVCVATPESGCCTENVQVVAPGWVGVPATRKPCTPSGVTVRPSGAVQVAPALSGAG